MILVLNHNKHWWQGFITGWWFGTFGLFFHILGISSSQVTNSYFFQRGRSTTNQISITEPWSSGHARHASAPGRSSSWRSESSQDVRTLGPCWRWNGENMALKMIMLNTNPWINMDISWFICWRWYMNDLFCWRWCMNIYIYILIHIIQQNVASMILCLKRNVLFHQQGATQRIQLKQQSSKAAFRSANGQRFPEFRSMFRCVQPLLVIQLWAVIHHPLVI